jgi:hypothetical protein
MRLHPTIFFIALLLTFIGTLRGQHIKFRLANQISGWTTVNVSDTMRFQTGGRYIPVLSISDSLSGGKMLDAEVAVNGYGNLTFSKYDAFTDGNIKPYRFWLRYSTNRLELRAGLQKINFGSASVLRPLMWFDKTDSRDPLQMTDGVYGLLGRYYFKKTANIWLWGLAGNAKVRGWDVAPTVKKTPEFGGRFQLPVPGGEAALTYHHRRADFSGYYPAGAVNVPTTFNEEKAGFDGKWDIGPGLWFEYVVKHNDPDNGILPQWESYMNIGMDYTLPVGNGLNLATEFFRYANKQEWGKSGNDNKYSVVSANYPFGLMNSIMAMVYYNWDQEEWYRFVYIQRKYDFWSFYLLAFRNPEQPLLFGGTKDRNLFMGKGLQFMAVVNF